MTMNRSLGVGITIGSLMLGVVVWAIVSKLVNQPDLLPGPSMVGEAFSHMLSSGELMSAVVRSLTRFCIGYSAGAALGILIGVVLGRSRVAYQCFGIVFEFMKGIPPIALAPIVIIWLGIGEISKYVVIAYVVCIVVAISVTSGALEIPLIRLRTAQFLGLSRMDAFRRIILPSIARYALIGLRNGIGFGFVALVSAELIGANSGVGQIIMDARFSLQTDKMIVGVIALGVLGASLQGVFDSVVAIFPLFKRL